MEQRYLLLVEDSDDDAFMFARAIKECDTGVTLARASNANEARELLSSVRPSLIALDCNLPGIGGLELLRELRMNEEFRRTPIVMLSGTRADIDLELAYAFGANSFLTKPTDYQDYLDQVLVLLHYWLVANRTSMTDDAESHPSSILGQKADSISRRFGLAVR